MRVLELGNYIIPAYAGMLLAEQGHHVTKWTKGTDPILELRQGDELWQWINHGKRLEERDVADVLALEGADVPEIIIDNFRPSALLRRGIVPRHICEQKGIRWVSVRSEVGDTSFDVIAQARSWMEYAPWAPFYIGDTAAGLWLAFKAVCAAGPGHFTLGHASVMQKLVEGELIVDRPPGPVPFDPPGTYEGCSGARVEYRGRHYAEPVRDKRWKLGNLFHKDGRIRI